jgi:hypothetical protein
MKVKFIQGVYFIVFLITVAEALGMGTSLYGGSVTQPGVGSSTGDFEIWLKVALEVECLSVGAL